MIARGDITKVGEKIRKTAIIVFLYSVDKHENGCILTFKVVIPSIGNTLNKIYITNTPYEAHALMFYDKRGKKFNLLLRNCVRQQLEDIEHTELFTE